MKNSVDNAVDSTPKRKPLSHSSFVKIIRAYYKENKRDFPWRQTQDPYKILVSEIMLQQTQTFRVKEKYISFIKEFPDFKALDGAPLQQVLKMWQGLGYNRRAVSLKKIATIVMEKYGGKLSNTLEELDALPGIGEATAASISAFAFNIPHPFIETNIRRVYLHFFFPHRKNVFDAELMPIIEKTLDKKNPREWYFALMDYGAMLKSRVLNPNRRSAHYTKQATFVGSNREIRGAILKVLAEMNLSSGKIKEKALAEKLSFDFQKIHLNVKALSKEGFFRHKKGFIEAL